MDSLAKAKISKVSQFAARGDLKMLATASINLVALNLKWISTC